MTCPLRSPLVWAPSMEGPALTPSGHLPVSKQHRVCQHLRREVDGGTLSLRPFILVLGSSLRCETWPGHERTASCQPHGSCDMWWLVAPSCLSQWGSEKLLPAKNMVNRNGTEFLPSSATYYPSWYLPFSLLLGAWSSKPSCFPSYDHKSLAPDLLICTEMYWHLHGFHFTFGSEGTCVHLCVYVCTCFVGVVYVFGICFVELTFQNRFTS